MNLVYADIKEVFDTGGQRMGKVCIKGALKDVPLMLLPDAIPGDQVLLCDGIPISKLTTQKEGGNHVSCNTRKNS